MGSSAQNGVFSGNNPRIWTAATDFNEATAPLLGFVVDGSVRERLSNHLRFARVLARGGHTNGRIEEAPVPPEALYIAFRRHELAVRRALEAHIRGEPMPSYPVPDWGNAEALEQWPSEDESS